MQKTLPDIVKFAAGIMAIAFVLFIVNTMNNMNKYMEQMTGHMAHMAISMDGMKGDVSIMTTEISKIDDVVAQMDENITAMSVDINVIQRSMSSDLLIMRKSVVSISHSLERMDPNMDILVREVSKMDDLIYFIGSDIHHGTKSFTSPTYFMRNMFP